MAEKLEEAASPTAAAMEEEEACFSDEILLDFTSDPPYAAVAGELQDQAAFFQDFFDTITDDLPGLPGESGGGEIEEEELEWISNKDAFPALETSFEIPAHSRSSSGSGSRSGGGAVGERPSPFWVMAAAASFSVPARPRSKGRMRRPRVLTALTPAPDAAAGAKKAAAAAERRRCQHCLAEETPQWRAGPEGPKTLCNACGVRYKSGRLVPEYRPASSPTFSAAIHSNSHRRILEMRRQKTSRDRRSTRSPALVTPPVI